MKANPDLVLGSIEIPTFGTFQIVPAQNAINCVDSREVDLSLAAQDSYTGIIYQERPIYGEIRTPGGSFGSAMALKRSYPDIPLLTAFRLSAQRDVSIGRIPTLHGHENALGFLGCGHIAKAASGHIDGYGIPAHEVRATAERVDLLAQIGLFIRSSMLCGDFQETPVLVVRSMDKTVIPISDSGARCLRYDQTRYEADLLEFAGFASREMDREISGQSLIESADIQRNVTLGQIALGRPIFVIDLLGETPIVSNQGLIAA